MKDAHAQARSSFQTWLSYGQPQRGSVFENMRATRKVFKSRLRWW